MAGTSQTTVLQRKYKPRRTVMARMSEISKSRGPLSRIATFCNRKIRVKVYTRSAVSVRGHCEGYISAYDKHWNLVMDDVDEIWTRKNKYKSLAFGKVVSCKSYFSSYFSIFYSILNFKLVLVFS